MFDRTSDFVVVCCPSTCSTIRSDAVGRRYGRFQQHPSPRAVAAALRRIRPRITPVDRHTSLTGVLPSDLTVLRSTQTTSVHLTQLSSLFVAYIVWQCSVLYCSTYRHLNTIFVLIIIIIIAVIVFVLHCFDIICLLLLL